MPHPIYDILLDYYPELVIIRDALEQRLEGYPVEKCNVTSRVLRAVLELEIICGYFMRFPHALNEDRGHGVYICLTLDQYPNIYKQISILPLDNPLFEPDTVFKEGFDYLTDESVFGLYKIKDLVKN